MCYRADETPKSGISAFFRFGQTSSSSQTRQLSALTNLELKEVTATGGVNAQLSSWANHEFVLGYAGTHSRQATHPDDFGAAAPVNLANLMGVDGAAVEAYVRIGASYIRTNAASNALKQWNLRGTVYLQRQGHLFSIGLDERRVFPN